MNTTKQFVLVSNLHGVDVFPKIGMNVAKEVTTDIDETPVYDQRDNPEIKAAFWSAILKRQFTVRYL